MHNSTWMRSGLVCSDQGVCLHTRMFMFGTKGFTKMFMFGTKGFTKMFMFVIAECSKMFMF